MLLYILDKLKNNIVNINNILLLVKHPSKELINFLTKNNSDVNIIYLSEWLAK